jgi:hypothetical protein
MRCATDRRRNRTFSTIIDCFNREIVDGLRDPKLQERFAADGGPYCRALWAISASD